MFKRRSAPPLGRRIRNAIWPEMGFKRSTSYLWHRVARIPDSSYAIAAGFACGAAVSFTPFVGLHFVIGAIMAWIIRANIISALIGTTVGNPWTFPFIWVWIYKSGMWMGAGAAHGDAQTLDFAALFAGMMEAALQLDIPYLMGQVWPVFWPMLVGSIPTFIVGWLVFYWSLNGMVGAYQHQRRRRLERRRTERRARSTGPQEGGDG